MCVRGCACGCLCVNVCVCVCVCVCYCMNRCVCTCLCVYICACACKCVCLCVRACVCHSRARILALSLLSLSFFLSLSVHIFTCVLRLLRKRDITHSYTQRIVANREAVCVSVKL